MVKLDDSFPDDLKAKLNDIMAKSAKFQVLFYACFLITVVVFVGTCVIRRDVPTGVWITKDQKILFFVVCVAQIMEITFCSQFIFAYDCIFMTCCTMIVVQIKILEYYCSQAGVCRAKPHQLEYYQKLRQCIAYHVFLLKFSKLLQKFYSFGVLMVYAVLGPLICVEMFATLESVNPMEKFRHGIALTVMMSGIAIYCIPIDWAINEITNIGYIIYNSSWFNSNTPNMRNPISLAIQISNGCKPFKAGQLVEVNSRSLISVLKICWSACTVIRKLKHHHQ